jgi:hypothetical protein
VAPTPPPAANVNNNAEPSNGRPAPPPLAAPGGTQETGTEACRGERIRLLSLDGFTDPRNDNTEIDTEFIIIHDLTPFPTTFQASRDVQRNEVEILESTVVQYQRMMRELDGTAEPGSNAQP